MTRSFTCLRASASPCFPSTAEPRPICCAVPTWRCTTPSDPAAATPSSTRRRKSRWRIGSPCWASCVSASPATNSSFTTSPRSTWRPARPLASRHWSAGNTPSRVCCCPPASCPRWSAPRLIVPLTRWVLNEALRQQQIWRERGRRPHDGRQHLRPHTLRATATSPTPWPS